MGAFIAAAAIGLFIGVASGMLGIGGGTLMVPMFRLFFGMSPLGATATSLFAIIPTSISGAIGRLRNKTCIIPLGLALGISGACASPIGVWLATMSPGWMVMAAAALVIGYSAITMFQKALSIPKKGATAKAATTPSEIEPATAAPAEPVDDFVMTRKNMLQAIAVGLVAGLLAGYVGVGGGFLMVPLMISLMGLSMKKASGTSLVAVIIIATPGVIRQAMLGNIDFIAGIAVVIGTIPGAWIGARLVNRVPERTLRLLFGCFLIIAAILLIAKELGFLG